MTCFWATLFFRNCTLTQRVNYFDSKKYCKVLIQQDVSNAGKTSTESNSFKLHWKLFWSVCKLPRILSMELKYPGFLRFLSYNLWIHNSFMWVYDFWRKILRQNVAFQLLICKLPFLYYSSRDTPNCNKCCQKKNKKQKRQIGIN